MFFRTFSRCLEGFWGFRYGSKRVLNHVKDDCYEWKKGNHENRGVLWRKKGSEKDVSSSSEEREKGDFAAVSSHEINIIPECKMGIVGKILDRGMRPSRVFKSQHFLK